jgi:hypothetical protein
MFSIWALVQESRAMGERRGVSRRKPAGAGAYRRAYAAPLAPHRIRGRLYEALDIDGSASAQFEPPWDKFDLR